MLSRHLRGAWQARIEAVNARSHRDREEGFGEVDIPEALARTSPKVVREAGWPSSVS